MASLRNMVQTPKESFLVWWRIYVAKLESTCFSTQVITTKVNDYILIWMALTKVLEWHVTMHDQEVTR